MTSDIIEQILDAHGGRGRWERIERVAVALRAGGPMFAMKGQARTLDPVRAVLHRDQTGCVAGSSPSAWVHQIRADGDLLWDLAALHHFATFRRWRVDDVATFTASALWTYVFLPAVLLDPMTRTRVGARGRHGLRPVRIHFPHDVATHSAHQTIWIDDDGLIRRHDYTALAFGRWATASQDLDGYRTFDGLQVATSWRVVPRLLGVRLPGPRLVWIEIDEVAPVDATGAARPATP